MPLCINTYERIHTPEENIINEHINFQNDHGLELPGDMKKLPPIHWIPKMHKNPTSARFIIGSKMSSLKPLGKTITKIFKLIFKMKRGYYRKAGYFSGLKQFWPIDSHNEVVNALDKISSKNKAISISTFDFSTLYTKIPHDKLIDVLSSTAKSVFNDTNRKNVCVSSKSAYFVKYNSDRNKFNVESIIECCKFLVSNAYFRIGDAIFRQTIGIPMGSDPAPFFANLFLSYYEAKWIKSQQNNDYVKARALRNTFRFIDDLGTLNDNGTFEESISQIYPEELVLNKENHELNINASYLDLNISVVENKFQYELYDKRRAFPFKAVRFPYSDSNMPSKMFNNTISTEILRICRASSRYSVFQTHSVEFIKHMIKQGAKISKVKGSINKLMSRHNIAFSKFNMDRNRIITDIFNFS